MTIALITLTSVVMKCFVTLVMAHIKDAIPDTLDPLQFAYSRNRSTDDVINAAIHTALSHQEHKDNYGRMLFIDYSCAFNTVILSRPAEKLLTPPTPGLPHRQTPGS